MTFITAFIGAILFSGLVSAVPRPQISPTLSMVPAAPTGTPGTSGTMSSAATPSPSAGGYGGSGGYGSGGYTSGGGWSSLATPTASAYGSSSTPTYGSGSSNWGGSGYNNCVAQCVASFGAPPASQPTATTASGGMGTGATITVIVAPTQGVLRYVPFAVNASVGDTIKFMWGANNHTVTKSSQLTPCNKTADALFASGTHNKDFVFTQVVNDTSPTYFYCGTPGHCQQGMFGIINPPNALGSPTTVAGMMSSLRANSSDVSAYASYTTKMTANNTRAANWGGNIDLATLPSWSHQFVAENVLFTRNFLASNAEVLKDNGLIDLSSASSTPLMIPQDLSAAISNASPSSSATTSTPASTATSTATSASTPTSSSTGSTSGYSSGASSLASPNVLTGLFIAIVTLFAL
jgi:plastocyanin